MDRIDDLARRMRAMRASGSDPYVLLICAGASIASGARASRTVVESVVSSYNLEAFDDHLRRSSPDERFAVLRDLVEGRVPSPGYAALAALIRAGYFREILSTNFDPLLEDAIAAEQMRRRDYVFLVHGVMPPDFVAAQFDRSEVRSDALASGHSSRLRRGEAGRRPPDHDLGSAETRPWCQSVWG